MPHPALILIDIQNDYFPDFPGAKMPLEGMALAAREAQALLEVFRARDWPRFHVRHDSVRPGATFFLPGTPGAQTHAVVAPLANEKVIVKNYPNSFRDTALLDELRAASSNEVVICGAMSNMCIDATTRAAADLGFKCTVVHDACAARALKFGARAVPADDVHASFMAALSGVYARVCARAELFT